jgi:hypothetical protein
VYEVKKGFRGRAKVGFRGVNPDKPEKYYYIRVKNH